MTPPLSDVIANLDDYSAWLAAVVAGLVALGWLARKVWRAIREARRRALELGRKIDALDRVVVRELSHGRGEVTTKDYARIAAGHATAIESLEQRATRVETRLDALERWRDDHNQITSDTPQPVGNL